MMSPTPMPPAGYGGRHAALGSHLGPIMAAGYIRVSRDKAKHGLVDEIISPEMQRAEILRYAESHKYQVPDNFIFEDLDKSGFNIPFEKRPGLMQIIRLAEQGLIQHVITYKISRLSRVLLDTLQITKLLSTKGISVIFINEGIDSGNHGHKIVLATLGAVAESQAEEIRNYAISIKAHQAEQGIVPGCVAPYGLVRKNKVFDKNPETFPHLKRMFDMVASGQTPYRVRKVFNSEGIKSPRGKQWSDEVMRDLIRNPTYIGQFRFKKEVCEARHKPFLPKDLWLRANDQLALRANHQDSRRHRMLSGLITCGQCGSPFNVHHGGGHARRVGYQCRNRFETGCPSPRLDAPTLEAALKSKLRELALNKAVLQRVAEKLEKEASRPLSPILADRDRLNTKLKKVQDKIELLLRDRYDGRIADDQFAEKNHQFLSERDELKAKLDRIEAQVENPRRKVERHQNLTAILQEVAQAWDSFSDEDIQDLLRELGVILVAEKDGVVFEALGYKDKLPGKATISTLYFEQFVDGLGKERGFWSQAQEQFLLRNWERHDARWIAKKLKRTESGVRQKLYTLRQSGQISFRKRPGGGLPDPERPEVPEPNPRAKGGESADGGGTQRLPNHGSSPSSPPIEFSRNHHGHHQD